jgi:uncharacterized protein YndB with AHSA1/START domain
MNRRTAAMVTKNSATTTFTMPSDTEIVITRLFDAPPALVFKAWTTPEHVAKWWGPRESTLPICTIDLRPGGAYRWVERGADGNLYPFKGEYLEIDPPRRLVYTQAFDIEPFADHPSIITMTLVEQEGGRTLMTSRSVYESKMYRDGHVASGMEPGMRETMERLDEHLATMA